MRKKLPEQNFFHRTRALLGDQAIAELQKPLVSISGLGGVGGAAFLTLVRTGVTRFRLAENGIFDPPDLNRQWAALGDTMGRPKVDVYVEWAKSINPELELDIYPEGITLANVQAFLAGANIYIGAIDVDKGKEVKDESDRISRQRKIPTFTCGAVGFGALMVNYDPNGMPPGEFWRRAAAKSTNNTILPSCMAGLFPPALMENLETSAAVGKLATCSVGAGMAGLLLGSEVMAYILRDTEYVDREIIFVPRYVAIDLLKMNLEIREITT